MDTKDRIHYYDIARGLLIIMVVFYHTMLRVDIPLATHVWNQFAFISFFMAGFFLITGLVTNFSRDNWLQFIWKKFKGIIIPTMTFLFIQNWLPFFFDSSAIPQDFGFPIDFFQGKMPWFISALFFSLIINYALIRYVKKKPYIIFLSFVLYFLGGVFHALGVIKYENEDVYCVDHILVMNIFLTIGYMLRDVKLRWWHLIITIPLFESVVLSTNYLPFGIPYVTGGNLYVDYISMIPFLIMAFCGSLTLLILCKLLKDNSVLEYVGKHSLGIYILQRGLILPLLQLLLLGQPNLSEYNRTIIFFLIVILVTLISAVISQIFKSKYLRWSMGIF